MLIFVFVTWYAEAMFASTPRKLGHLVHHYGGTAVGSFIEPDQSPLSSSVTRAMFVDATHDNDPGHIQVGILKSSQLLRIYGQ